MIYTESIVEVFHVALTSPQHRSVVKVIEQFATAFQAAPGATLIVGSDGLVVFTNRVLDELFGYEANELIGQPIEVLVPGDTREIHPELRDAYFCLPSSRTMGRGRDLFGISKTGDRIPVEIGLNHVVSGTDTIVVASVLDLSERKREEEKTRLAIDAAGNAMIMTDSEGVIILANSMAFEMFGYAPDELVGEKVELLIPSAVRRRHSVYRTSYVSNPVKRSMGQGQDLFGCRKDGSEFPLEIGLTPINNHSETLTMATVQDISDRRAAEEEIRKQNVDLTRLNLELAQFAYSASHDLKAPLATIEGLLGCIEEDALEGDIDSIGQHALMAKSVAKKLKDLIEGILGLAKAESLEEGTLSLNLRELTRETIALLVPDESDASVEIVVTIDDSLRYRAQPVRLRQILENLVSNALKYQDPDKSEHRVEIAAEATADTVNLIVQDNGIGIPKNRHSEVFGLFKRFSNHDIEGGGLGLALAQQHVEFLGGRIVFDSSPAGTRFLVQLPQEHGA